MAVRWRKSFSLGRGARLNVGKKSGSVTFGRKGASLNIGTKGAALNLGIPGTGLSKRIKLTGGGGRYSKVRLPKSATPALPEKGRPVSTVTAPLEGEEWEEYLQWLRETPSQVEELKDKIKKIDEELAEKNQRVSKLFMRGGAAFMVALIVAVALGIGAPLGARMFAAQIGLDPTVPAALGLVIAGLIFLAGGAAVIPAALELASTMQKSSGRTTLRSRMLNLLPTAQLIAERFDEFEDLDIVGRVLRGEVWDGMTERMLALSLGEPVGKDQKKLKTKTKEIWKYDQYGSNRFATTITVENGIVVGWSFKG